MAFSEDSNLLTCSISSVSSDWQELTMWQELTVFYLFCL